MLARTSIGRPPNSCNSSLLSPIIKWRWKHIHNRKHYHKMNWISQYSYWLLRYTFRYESKSPNSFCVPIYSKRSRQLPSYVCTAYVMNCSCGQTTSPHSGQQIYFFLHHLTKFDMPQKLIPRLKSKSISDSVKYSVHPISNTWKTLNIRVYRAVAKACIGDNDIPGWRLKRTTNTNTEKQGPIPGARVINMVHFNPSMYK